VGDFLGDPPSCLPPYTTEEADVQGSFVAPGTPRGQGSFEGSVAICLNSYTSSSSRPRVVAPRPPVGNAVTAISADFDHVLTNTATRTPTDSQNLTNRSAQQQVVVPTLSFPMLGLLAAALIGAALWVLTRR
jgi:hypothetical protein